MVAHLIKVARSRRLFVASCMDARVKIDPTPALTRLRHGENLVIRVEVEGVPQSEQVKLDIVMADVFRDSDLQYPISGSPYMFFQHPQPTTNKPVRLRAKVVNSALAQRSDRDASLFFFVH